MPVYKGTTEIASGKLYKAAANIENGYKGTDQFYVNEITVTLTAPTGWVLSQSSITGVPGAGSGNFTLTRSTPGALVQQRGTGTVSGGSLSFGSTSTSGSNAGINNTVTITTSFTIPTSNQSVTLAIAGMTDHNYTAHFSAAWLVSPSTTVLTNPNNVSSIPIGTQAQFVITRVADDGTNPPAGIDSGNSVYYSQTATGNISFTGFTIGGGGSNFSTSWSSLVSASGPNAGPSTVTYPEGTINFPSGATLASGATISIVLVLNPAYNIYLDGQTVFRTAFYA